MAVHRVTLSGDPAVNDGLGEYTSGTATLDMNGNVGGIQDGLADPNATLSTFWGSGNVRKVNRDAFCTTLGSRNVLWTFPATIGGGGGDWARINIAAADALGEDNFFYFQGLVKISDAAAAVADTSAVCVASLVTGAGADEVSVGFQRSAADPNKLRPYISDVGSLIITAAPAGYDYNVSEWLHIFCWGQASAVGTGNINVAVRRPQDLHDFSWADADADATIAATLGTLPEAWEWGVVAQTANMATASGVYLFGPCQVKHDVAAAPPPLRTWGEPNRYVLNSEEELLALGPAKVVEYGANAVVYDASWINITDGLQASMSAFSDGGREAYTSHGAVVKANAAGTMRVLAAEPWPRTFGPIKHGRIISS